MVGRNDPALEDDGESRWVACPSLWRRVLACRVAELALIRIQRAAPSVRCRPRCRGCTGRSTNQKVPPSADGGAAVGCGWAFRLAEWLADVVVPALAQGASDDDLVGALDQYREAHRFAEAHDEVGRIEALARPATPAQRAMMAAATSDPDVARQLGLFAMRVTPAPPLAGAEPAAILAQRW